MHAVQGTHIIQSEFSPGLSRHRPNKNIQFRYVLDNMRNTSFLLVLLLPLVIFLLVLLTVGATTAVAATAAAAATMTATGRGAEC